MNFTPIDLQHWPRGQLFQYFSSMAPTGYSMTVNLDISNLHRSVKQAGIKFFPAYLWLVTKNLNDQIEFKVSEKDGVLGYYDTLTPMYASFHNDTGTFSLMWTEYSSSFPLFYRQYLSNQARFGGNHGILAQPQTPPPNAYTVSCVPWIAFQHFAVHCYDNKPYYFPSVEAGKFFSRDEALWMPLSLSCHHATTDGWHISRFLDSLQRDMDHFDDFLL